MPDDGRVPRQLPTETMTTKFSDGKLRWCLPTTIDGDGRSRLWPTRSTTGHRDLQPSRRLNAVVNYSLAQALSRDNLHFRVFHFQQFYCQKIANPHTRSLKLAFSISKLAKLAKQTIFQRWLVMICTHRRPETKEDEASQSCLIYIVSKSGQRAGGEGVSCLVFLWYQRLTWKYFVILRVILRWNQLIKTDLMEDVTWLWGLRVKKINGRHFMTFNDHGRSTKIRPKGRTRLRLFPKFGRVSRGLDTISRRWKNVVSEILDICELIEFQYAQACLEYRQASDSITM